MTERPVHVPHAVSASCRTSSGAAPTHHAAHAAANGWRARQFGESVLGTPLVAWWPTRAAPSRIVWGGIHGEEVVTSQVLQHLLRVVHADDACAVVVPVLNPDGVLACTRQNARGVDLNRNFPGPTWRDAPSPTYWPTTTVRTSARRTMLSSPGTHPGSEPEVAAICALVEQVEPAAVIDLHTPLECLIAHRPDALDLARHLAEPTGFSIITELDGPTPGDSATWCQQHGIITVTYELELATLPVIWTRHAEALTRCVVDRTGG